MPRTLAPDRSELYEATRLGLLRTPKELPPVWLYDERGSLLYEQITRLPDYYLPARETEILSVHAGAIAERTRARTLVELGAGNGRRTRFLLDALTRLERFVPVDVSEEILRETARTVAADYPELEVEERVGDFERELGELPGPVPRLIAVLGSTIGNLYPEQRAALLGALAARLGAEDAFLLGIDLVKDTARLRAAYHDETGVTEAFVRNALTALNRELEATFERERFAYDPVWDSRNERMDIGLRALASHIVRVERLGLELRFTEGERLRVEISSKFRRESFELELERAGLRLDSWWTDQAGDFALVFARPEGRPDV
jgi:L-histidine N-alpha-methyltransferase